MNRSASVFPHPFWKKRRSDMAKSLRGHCLVAAKPLRDPNFYKTAVLIVEHGDHGAMGLVINRPSSVLVCNALAEFFDLSELSQPMYMGGPVEPRALLVLHNVADLSGGEPAVVPGVWIGNSEDAFRDVLKRAAIKEPGLQFRLFSGCAGWAPGQLEGELSRGDWHTVPGCRDAVFHDDPYQIYDFVLQQVFESNRLLPHTCSNPHWN